MNIVFIGGGNMASSLIGGLIADGVAPSTISVVEINADKRQQLAQRFKVQVLEAFAEVAGNTDMVVFCIKPQHFKDAAETTAEHIKQRQPLVISVAAGIRTADINHWLGGSYAIVRAMSNTPALVQTGASALYATDNVSDKQRDEAESLLRAVGIVEWVDDEALMDVVTALSGSGPAYFFRIMEAMVKAGEQLGLSRDVAHLLTIQTALGAAKMALESDEDIATLRDNVTSPGGTTERGLKVMNDTNIDGLVLDILKAAQQRATELADQLGEH
ncbi:MAG: pyrroline-5-carboxylate reductase [Gammaproteobacteria bacterium]|jgi:pyrroline-5-carboxylate reductase